MSLGSSIELLPPDAIAGIAAGEVVERPASVVKELVENSLDAGATRIGVVYDDNSVQRIEVSDNGSGIPAPEVGLAFDRHATSKLRSLSGLPAVATFGFRGEALPSIAAVSGVEMITRSAGEEAGTRVAAGPGGTERPSAAPSPAGTRVVVADLFSDTPARRKFLRSKNVEYGQVADTVRRFALLRPDVHLELRHNGRLSFELPATSALVERVGQVWGPESGTGLVVVEARHAGMTLDGLVGTMGGGNGTARRVGMFINGRWVRDRLLFRALMDACRGHLVKGRYPIACLFLGVEPATVDVNVHPAKLEVRFSQPDTVGRFLTEGVGEALRNGFGPLGRPVTAEVPGYRLRESTTAGQARGGSSQPALPEHPVPPGAGSEPVGYRPAEVEPVVATGSSELAAEPLPGIVGAGATMGGLEVVGQVFDGYLVCQAPEELLLVDQHALHERILYERLMAAYERTAIESQPLLVPVTVRVGADGVEAVERHAGALGGAGWELEAFGPDDVIVRAVPALLADADTASMVERTVADLVRARSGTADAVRTAMASAACHAAVRVGRHMERTEARALLEDAASVNYTATCPHGRPVAKRFGRAEVERMFGR